MVSPSGGGFRASFFHLGVLRRLAEYDLLRYVTTISSVSGGSIVAAHFYLYLRLAVERSRKAALTRQDYIDLVDKLTKDFIEGNRKDLRNRLFVNPWTHFLALTMGRSYGRAMARLYSRHLYRKVTQDLFRDPDTTRNGIPLHRAIANVDDAPLPSPFDNEDEWKRRFPSSGYPNRRVYAARTLRDINAVAPVRIPALAINATCLSTGGSFVFMFNEVGGPNIGFIRTDEVFMLLQYKLLLADLRDSGFENERFKTAVNAALTLGTDLEKDYPYLPDTAFKNGDAFPARTADHLRLYLTVKSAGRAASPDEAWNRRAGKGGETSTIVARFLKAEWLVLEHFVTVDFGTLRQAKVAAWYLLDERNWHGDKPRGGMKRSEYVAQFWRALRAIDDGLDEALDLEYRGEPSDDLLYFILDWYYLRSAEVIDWEAPRALSELTVSHAVAASANFPPVFTPFKVFNLFERDIYETVALTDGGVQDNQGIDWLVDDGCSYIIASDAGGLVQPACDPPESRVTMMNRIIDILMGGLRHVQLRNVRETVDVGWLLQQTTSADGDHRLPELLDKYRLRGAAVFHMTSNPKEGARHGLPSFEASSVARIRTDLDSFNDVEIASLMYQGYQLADRFARDLAVDEQSPFKSAEPPPAAESPYTLPSPSAARSVLSGSARVVGRFVAVAPFKTIGFAIVLGLVLALTLRNARIVTVAEGFKALDQRRVGIHDYFHGAPAFRHVDHFFDRLGAWIGEQNVFFVLFAVWATYLLGSTAMRVMRTRVRRWPTFIGFEIWKSRVLWFLGLFVRLPNVIAIVSFILLVYTQRLIWVLGFVPLWCIPLAFTFVTLFALSFLWRQAGRMKTE